MATSVYPTTQVNAEQFVESAGAVLFHVSRRQVVIVRDPKRDTWLLAKGRRNVSEQRAVTAVREVTEETGFECELLPLNMATRAPPAVEQLPFYPDVPRTHSNVTEPFMLSYRKLEGELNVKLVWWYIAAIKGSEQDVDIEQGRGEETYEARLFGFDEALTTLTYQVDRDVVRRAIEIIDANNTGEHSSHL